MCIYVIMHNYLTSVGDQFLIIILNFLMSAHVVARRQIRGPNPQYRTLLDTMVLTERGARFELLQPDSQV